MKQTLLLSCLALLPLSAALAQNVGVNTPSPSLSLDVSGTATTGATLGLRNYAPWDHLYFRHDGGTALMRAGGANAGLAFQVGTAASGSYGDQTYVEALRLLPTGQVGVGTATPASSAVLDVTSTTQGLLLPRLTTAQMNAIAAPVAGLLIYNTTAGKFYGYETGTGTLAQSTLNARLRVVNPGQSFAAPETGTITRFTVTFVSLATSGPGSTFTLNLYQGEGISGTPVLTATTTVNFPANSTLPVPFTISPGFAVTAGQQYTLSLSYSNTNLVVGAATGVTTTGQFYNGTSANPNYNLTFSVDYSTGQWVVLN